MSKTNLEIWESLSSEQYFTSHKRAVQFFRDLEKFENAVGFDENSNGFLAIHRKHAPSAFDKEIPVCVFLKTLGFRVLLEAEEGDKKSPDCTIDGLSFEIKQIARAKNVHRAIVAQARTGYSKSKRLLFHIIQVANLRQLEGGIAETLKLYKSIKVIWMVKSDTLFVYDFDAKKLRRAAP